MVEVGCAGILVEDTFCGPIRKLPGEGQLLTVDSMPSKAGGCAANVAIGLAKQGIQVEVFGSLGRDPSAQVVLSCLRNHGVGCQQVAFNDRHPTSRTVILLVERQDRRYIHAFGANQEFTVADINPSRLMGLKVFYLGGLFALPGIRAEELAGLLSFCRRQGIITVIDVVAPQGFRDADQIKLLLPYIDYFIPNEDEARQLTGHMDMTDQIRALQAGGAKTVVITKGAAGCIAAQGKDLWRAGVYPAEAVDPSGSGDAFTSGIITGVLCQWDMVATLRYASALGASATRMIGTTDGVFNAKEAKAFLAANPLEITGSSMHQISHLRRGRKLKMNSSKPSVPANDLKKPRSMRPRRVVRVSPSSSPRPLARGEGEP